LKPKDALISRITDILKECQYPETDKVIAGFKKI
jgi:hypothetical protein